MNNFNIPQAQNCKMQGIFFHRTEGTDHRIFFISLSFCGGFCRLS